MESINDLSLPVNPVLIALNPTSRAALVAKVANAEVKDLQAIGY